VGGDVGEAAEFGGCFVGFSVVSRVSGGGVWLGTTITPPCPLRGMGYLLCLPLASPSLCNCQLHIPARVQLHGAETALAHRRHLQQLVRIVEGERRDLRPFGHSPMVCQPDAETQQAGLQQYRKHHVVSRRSGMYRLRDTETESRECSDHHHAFGGGRHRTVTAEPLRSRDGGERAGGAGMRQC